MSFAELAYQLLQAYDFYHLHRVHACRLQIGGSDQWGNIVAGVEAISRLADQPAAALTFPLLTTGGGEKMGKSAGNAVWLDPAMTSPFDLYQYFVRLPDEDARRLLPLLTLLPAARLAAAAEEHAARPEARVVQKTLAAEVTAFVHGRTPAARAAPHPA